MSYFISHIHIFIHIQFLYAYDAYKQQYILVIIYLYYGMTLNKPSEP